MANEDEALADIIDGATQRVIAEVRALQVDVPPHLYRNQRFAGLWEAIDTLDEVEFRASQRATREREEG